MGDVELSRFLACGLKNPIVINEELVDICALINTIINEKILLCSNDKLIETIKLTNTYHEAVLLAYGYYYMKNNDIYDGFEKNKKNIYLKFGDAYNNELFKTLESLAKTNTDNNDDYTLENSYEFYEKLPTREKMIKPVFNIGMYDSFYADPNNMWEYLYCKRLSSKYAEEILDNGIDKFVESVSYTLDCYKGTQDEDSIKHAIKGVPKELRRKNKKLSNKKIKGIEAKLKSI